MEGLVNKSSLLSLFHYLERLFLGDFLCESLGSSVACGLTKGEAIHHRSIRGTWLSQHFSPLATETPTHSNVVEIVDDLFYRLAWEDEFIGHL